LAAVLVLGAIPAPVLAAAPQVTNVVAVQRPGTRLVDVTYDLYDADGHAMTVALDISPDGGLSFPIHCMTVSGDVGIGIMSGTGRHIEWDAGVDYPSHLGETYAPKVIADDGQGFDGMVRIPAGNVRLGQPGNPLSEPVNDFYVQGFYIDRYEVSNAKYKAFIDAGGYTTQAYWNPVGWAWRVANSITLPDRWNDTIYHGGGITGNGQFPVGVSWWEADAYSRWAGVRLPTEAEWEKAAKGGCETHGDPGQCDASDTPSYPWGEGISGSQANFSESGDPYENNGWTTPVGYYDGSNHGGYQTLDSPSPYGLYDVVGNVTEWCSTKYAPYPYDPNDGRENPPVSYHEQYRVIRGASCGHPELDVDLRCAHRHAYSPDSRPWDIGFRCARTGGWGVGPLFHLDTQVPPMGSCCALDGTCAVTLQAACTAPSSWTLAGVCDPNPCDQPQPGMGACCTSPSFGCCELLTPMACAERPGMYLGDGTSCAVEGIYCEITMAGACCLADGTCTEVSVCDCGRYGGRFMGGSSFCDPNPCEATPVLLESWAALSLPEGLQILWEVPLATTGAMYRVWRDPVAGPHDAAPTPDAVLVSSAWVSASAEGIIAITDPGAPRGATIRYFLEMSATGARSEFLGPAEARWDPPTLAWSAGPTPFRDTVRLAPPRTGPARAEIFDPAGRLVRTLVRADGNAPLEWDGRDDVGRDAPTGIYIVRVGSTAGGAVARLVKIR
jgi:formylglycine-generating enzyme required for sulfatase activity